MQMLSLAKNIAELDRLDNHRRTALDAYIGSIRGSADSLIRFEAKAAAKTAELLSALAEEVERESGDESIRASRVQLWESLQEFRLQGERHIEALREQVAATTQTLQQMLVNVSGLGSPHHDQMQEEISNLRSYQAIEDILELKNQLRTTTERLNTHLEDARREHKAVVAQLRDEIATLHRQLERPQSAPKTPGTERVVPPPPPANGSTPGAPVQSSGPVATERPKPQSGPVSQTPLPADATPVPVAAEEPVAEVAAPVEAPAPASYGMRKPELESAVRDKAGNNETFCVTVVWMSNLATLFTKHDADLVLNLMTETSRRLDEAMVGNPFWGRWEDDCYLIVHSEPKSAAARASQQIASRVGGEYVIDHNGAPHSLTLKMAVGVVERAKDETGTKLLARAGQLLKGLRAMP